MVARRLFVSLNCRNHHICGIINNPLECLRFASNMRTTVVVLDSWTARQELETRGQEFWAGLLLHAWDALEAHREDLGLCKERPTLLELRGKMIFRCPKVRNIAVVASIPSILIDSQVRQQTNGYDCGLHVIRNVQLALRFWYEAQEQLVRMNI